MGEKEFSVTAPHDLTFISLFVALISTPINSTYPGDMASSRHHPSGSYQWPGGPSCSGPPDWENVSPPFCNPPSTLMSDTFQGAGYNQLQIGSGPLANIDFQANTCSFFETQTPSNAQQPSAFGMHSPAMSQTPHASIPVSSMVSAVEGLDLHQPTEVYFGWQNEGGFPSSVYNAGSTPSQPPSCLSIVIPHTVLCNNSLPPPSYAGFTLVTSQQDYTPAWAEERSRWELLVFPPVSPPSRENNYQIQAVSKIGAILALRECWDLLQARFHNEAVPDVLSQYHEGLLLRVDVTQLVTRKACDDRKLYVKVQTWESSSGLKSQFWKRKLKETMVLMRLKLKLLIGEYQTKLRALIQHPAVLAMDIEQGIFETLGPQWPTLGAYLTEVSVRLHGIGIDLNARLSFIPAAIACNLIIRDCSIETSAAL